MASIKGVGVKVEDGFPNSRGGSGDQGSRKASADDD